MSTLTPQEMQQAKTVMTEASNAIAAEEPAVSSDDIGPIPKKFLEKDREIQHDIEQDYMSIGTDHPLYAVCWVNYTNVNGQMVWNKKARGWRVATALEFPDAKYLLREDNTIRVGDCLLMFIRKDYHLKFIRREEEKRLRQQYGSEAAITALAEKYPDTFANVWIESQGEVMPENIARRMQSRSRSAAARKAAANAIGNKLNSGRTIPGVSLPGGR